MTGSSTVGKFIHQAFAEALRAPDTSAPLTPAPCNTHRPIDGSGRGKSKAEFHTPHQAKLALHAGNSRGQTHLGAPRTAPFLVLPFPEGDSEASKDHGSNRPRVKARTSKAGRLCYSGVSENSALQRSPLLPWGVFCTTWE